jgi:ABC-type glycerol-3-phosphate transport system substrate-binding protein
MKYLRTTALIGAMSIASTTAMAGGHVSCDIASGRINIVGNEFPAIQTVVATAKECAGEGVDFSSNLTKDHESVNVPGMQGNPAEYTGAIVANSSATTLMSEDVIRPLNDLIAEYGADIPDTQKITLNGQVMAIAFMANAQTLMYRKDVLEEAGVEVPTSYEELLEAAATIKEAGLMEYPVTGTYAAGWNLAEEFVNLYIGHGGEFFEPGSAKPSINNAQGVATLEMMKALSGYMNPDYLTYDSNAAGAEWEAGNAALMNMWGSRAGVLMDGEGSVEGVAENTMAAGPLMVGGSGVPATTLWWDGWTVSKNISDEDAAATFQALAKGSSDAALNDETMGQAVWMIPGYTPARGSEGVLAAINARAKPYPMLPYMGLMHTALGDNIADFLQGSESAEQTLSDIEAAYTSAAQEKGFLN